MSLNRDWSTIRHFKREEFVKDPDRISWDVVLLVDEMRDVAGTQIHIDVAWDNTGHVEDSSHYTTSRDFSTAVDLYFLGWTLLDQWLFAERFPWNGIGLYPYWSKPGLHLDLRKLGRDYPHLGKRWWRDNAGIYRSFDRSMLSTILAMPAVA